MLYAIRMLLGKEGYCEMQIYKLAEAGHSDVILMFTDWLVVFDLPHFCQLVLCQSSHSFV